MRFSAFSLSLVLHGVAAVVVAGIRVGLPVPALDASRPEDARFEARVVERPPALVDELACVLPPTVDLSAIPTHRGGEDPVPALDALLADDEPPPPAAPSIAVEGGAHAPVAPREWSPRPSLVRSAFFGRGHGGRRADGRGRGGVGDRGVGGAGTEAASILPTAPSVEPARQPVRIAARLLRYVEPAYPESARARGLEGVVRVEVEVLADGAAGDVRIVASSGSRALDDAAVDAVRKWTFAAATLDGVAVCSTVTLPAIRFRIE